MAKVAAAIRYGPLILTALMSLALQMSTTPEELQAKVIFLGDSTTADAKFTALFVPEDIQFLTAKHTRFMSWLSKITLWENIPHVLAHCPGQLNSLAHVLSHVAQQLKELAQTRRSGKACANAYPITIHSYFGTVNERQIDSPPQGFTIHSLPLSTADVKEIVRISRKIRGNQ